MYGIDLYFPLALVAVADNCLANIPTPFLNVTRHVTSLAPARLTHCQEITRVILYSFLLSFTCTCRQKTIFQCNPISPTGTATTTTAGCNFTALTTKGKLEESETAHLTLVLAHFLCPSPMSAAWALTAHSPKSAHLSSDAFGSKVVGATVYVPGTATCLPSRSTDIAELRVATTSAVIHRELVT